MATRKCGNIYFPKYFQAVFYEDFFSSIIWGWRGQKHSLKKFVRCTIWRSRTVSYDPRVFFKKIFLVLYPAYVCVPFLGS